MTRPATVLAVVILAASCSTSDEACDGRLDLFSCEDPDVDHVNAQGEPDPCHEDDILEPCPGQCVPFPPAGWDTLPMLVWMGTGLAPDCPADRAGSVVFDGFMGLPDPPECPPCTCDPPTGECEIPEILTANEAPFCGVGVTEDLLPAVWAGGQCIEFTPPIDAMSVTIGPLTMTETGCKPSGPPPPRDGAAPGKTTVRACRGVAYPPCLDPGLLCVPSSEPPPPGFSQCIFQRGEHACPETYPEQHIAFDGVDDQRSCSDCSCEEPKGSACTATVSVFNDTKCELVIATAPMSAALGEQCMALEVGVVTTLDGLRLTQPVYEAGACEPSGGKLVGTAKAIETATICCLDSGDP